MKGRCRVGSATVSCEERRAVKSKREGRPSRESQWERQTGLMGRVQNAREGCSAALPAQAGDGERYGTHNEWWVKGSQRW